MERGEAGWGLAKTLPSYGYASLAYDSSGAALVAYESLDYAQLKFARRELTSGIWTEEVVDNVDAKPQVSLKLDPGGNPSVAYCELWLNPESLDRIWVCDLKFAWRKGP